MRVDRVLFLEPLWLAYQYTGFLRKCKPCLQDFSVSGGLKSQKQYCGRAVRLFRRSAAARLAVTKEMAEKLGGEISASGTPKSGTVFQVAFCRV